MPVSKTVALRYNHSIHNCLPAEVNLLGPFAAPCMWIEDLRFDWTPYLANGKPLTLRKNDYLFRYGEQCEAVYALLSGRVRLSLTTADGDERTFMVVGTHGLLGEAELNDIHEHVTSAVANVGCELVSFDHATFRMLMGSHPEVAGFCLKNLSRKMTILTFQALENTYASAQNRIVRALWDLASTYGQRRGSSILIDVKFTQQEMSSVVGVSRVTVAQAFKELCNTGLLERIEGKYVIHHSDVFYQRVEQSRLM